MLRLHLRVVESFRRSSRDPNGNIQHEDGQGAHCGSTPWGAGDRQRGRSGGRYWPKRSLWVKPKGARVSNNGGNGLKLPGSPIRSLCGTPIGGRMPHNGGMAPEPPGSPIRSLCGTPIGGRMPHNGENGSGAARIANPLIVRHPYRGTDATQWRTSTIGADGWSWGHDLASLLISSPH